MAKLFASTEDPNQMLQNAASDLGLHCMPITLLSSLVTCAFSQTQVISALIFFENQH